MTIITRHWLKTIKPAGFVRKPPVSVFARQHGEPCKHKFMPSLLHHIFEFLQVLSEELVHGVQLPSDPLCCHVKIGYQSASKRHGTSMLNRGCPTFFLSNYVWPAIYIAPISKQAGRPIGPVKITLHHFSRFDTAIFYPCHYQVTSA